MQQSEFVVDDTRARGPRLERGGRDVTVTTLHAPDTRVSEGRLENVVEQLPDELAGVFSVENERATVPDEAEATTMPWTSVRRPRRRASTGPKNAFIGGGR
jgi:hypothetical protein